MTAADNPHHEVIGSWFTGPWFVRLLEVEADIEAEAEAEAETSEDDFDEGVLRLEGVEVWFRVQLHGG